MPSGASGFFISYARTDAAYVQRLIEHLESLQLSVWLDARLEWGARVPVEIRSRLAAALGIIVIMSPASETSEWVEREILEGQQHGRQFLPILLRGKRHFLLAASNYFDARDGRMPGDPEIRRLRAIAGASGATTGQAPASEPPAARPSVRVVPVATPTTEVSLRKLRGALKEGQLAHADILTTALLLQAAKRQDRGWMRRADAAQLPYELIGDIDDAWSTFCQGQHGFAVQMSLHTAPPPGAPPGRHRDFLQLALSVGWKGLRGEVSPRYSDLVDADEFPPGFFPTLRNPQLEQYESWHDKWTDTVMAVHLKLRQWGARG